MNRLTPRQREVCICLLLGLNCKEAARRMGISPRTVEQHRERAIKKCGAVDMVDLLIKLWKAGETAQNPVGI